MNTEKNEVEVKSAFSTEVALKTGGSYNLNPMDAEVMSAIKEELDGLGSISFDSVKMPAGGGAAFEVAGDDPDSPEMVKDVTGIILHHHAANAYWPDKTTLNTPPTCVSNDGKTGTNLETGETFDCSKCPKNKFRDNKQGKECKNTHRLYVLPDGEILPVIMVMPPSSLMPLKDYFAKRILLKGNRTSDVVTKITLKKAQNAEGITYSQAVFARVGDLNNDQKTAIKPTIEAVKALASRVELFDENSVKNNNDQNDLEEVPF